MKWIKERDALIAQTMAFVQSVSGGKEGLSRFDPGQYGAGAAKPEAKPPAKPEAQPEPVAPVEMKTVEIPGPPKTGPTWRDI